MAHLYHLLEPFYGVSEYYVVRRRRMAPGEFEDKIAKVASSSTVYVGNLSFFTREEQLHALFSQVGRVCRIIMGLNAATKTPCGFCFVEYDNHEQAARAQRLFAGARLDSHAISVQVDAGFEPGRQYGRGRFGGQVRDEVAAAMGRRTDPGRPLQASYRDLPPPDAPEDANEVRPYHAYAHDRGPARHRGRGREGGGRRRDHHRNPRHHHHHHHHDRRHSHGGSRRDSWEADRRDSYGRSRRSPSPVAGWKRGRGDDDDDDNEDRHRDHDDVPAGDRSHARQPLLSRPRLAE